MPGTVALGCDSVAAVWVAYVAGFLAIWVVATLGIDAGTRPRWVDEVEEWLRGQ